jgi:hypothetical protein
MLVVCSVFLLLYSYAEALWASSFSMHWLEVSTLDKMAGMMSMKFKKKAHHGA